jgi:hypothetical protein
LACRYDWGNIRIRKERHKASLFQSTRPVWGEWIGILAENGVPGNGNAVLLYLRVFACIPP